MRTPSRLPSALSDRSSSTAAKLLSRSGKEVDIALAGLPFRMATAPDIPASVETIPLRKEQFDTELDPGEQTLSGWWRRSQESFHEGAGNVYAESRLNTNPSFGFFDSMGVEVFTQNQVTLLRQMELMDGSAQFSRLNSFARNGVRKNYCTNPGAEVDLTGWTGTDETYAPTLTRDSAHVDTGSWAIKVEYSGNDNSVGNPPTVTVPVATVPPNTPYTATVRVWVATGCPNINTYGNFNYGNGTGTARDQWVTITHHATSDGSGVAQLLIWPDTPPSTGDTFWVDSVLVEVGTQVGEYFDGSSVDCEWEGVAGLSTSLQTISSTDSSISAVAAGQLWTSPDKATAFTSVHAPVGKVIVDGFLAGLSFYDIASDGTLYEGLVSSPGTASSWPLNDTVTRLIYGKSRLWVIGGRKIWQPDLTLAAGTAQDPILTNPNAGWRYTCVTEGPSAMYFGGHDGRNSSIDVISLADDGTVPALSGARITAVLPGGELVQELGVLAGQFIGIGTNKGFRVGVFNGDSLTYGPILFSPEGIRECVAMATQDRFFLVSFRTTSGPAVAYKVDTGTQLADGVLPYAKNVYVGDPDTPGVLTSLVVVGDDVFACAQSGAVYAQSSDQLVVSGFLRTGRIRFRTNEPKVFKYLQIETRPLEGAIQMIGYEETGSPFDILTHNERGSVSSQPGAINADLGPLRQMAVQFNLFRNPDDHTQGPELNSFLLRALPAAAPQRLYTLPLLCFDFEQARSGQRYGNEGFAEDRLAALQALEDSSDILTFQDLRRKRVVGESVTIESIKFVQTAPGQQYDKSSGTGGIVILQLRTVSA